MRGELVEVFSKTVSAPIREPQQATENGDWANDEQNLVPATLVRKELHAQSVTAVPSE